MPMLVQCPNPACGASCSVAEPGGDRQFRCPKCDKPFRVRPTQDEQTVGTKQSQPASNTNPFPVLPAELGRYRLLRLLGRGGMGAVYLAQDSQLGRQVALKVPFFDAAESPHRAERFVREARSAAILHHPNICTVFDAGQIDGRPFITMAHLAGTPLDREIDPQAPMPQRRAAEIVRKIALALEHAHSQGIVHRDLKPANVMLAADGEPVVMDFGLAKRVLDVDPSEGKLTRDGGILGTPSYMAPEQVKGESAAIGPATDVYALGVMLFEMLTGRTPYTGAMGVVMGQILAAPVPPVKEFRPDVDARLDAICRKALAKKPADRFPSMTAFSDVLGYYLQAPSSPPPPLPVPPTVAVAKAPALVVERTPFEDLDDASPPLPASKKAKWGRVVAVALALALLATLGGWLALVVLRVETPNGTLVVEMDDKEVEARIKNGKLILSGPDGKDRYTLTANDRSKELEASPYKIRVEGADGLVLDTPEFTIKKGQQVTVRVTLEQKAVVKKDKPDLDPDRKAAEYVLSIGGAVKVNGQDREVKAAADLPPEAFRLTLVDLQGNKQVSDVGLTCFEGCSNLTVLWLRNTQVSDAGLAHFKGCKSLTELLVDNTQVGDAAVARIKEFNSLTTLNLCSTKVSEAGLASLQEMSSLRKLSLGGPQLTDDGLEYLKKLADLEILGLGFSKVTDPGLVNLKGMTRLQGLDLNNDTEVTDEGLIHLKGLLGLRELKLKQTGVTDAGLEHLAGLTNLDFLDLGGTAVTDKGVAKLKVSLANCKIDR
jgi:eukaryotic-like serine/threonine-protein kinase